MEYTESKEAADENGAVTQTNKRDNKSDEHGDNPAHANEAAGTRALSYTAIERQIAAVSTLGYGSQIPETANHSHDRRKKNDRRKTHRFGLGSFLILLWLVAVGLLAIFTDFGRALQKVVSDTSQVVAKAAVNQPSSSVNSSPSIQPPISQLPATIQPPPNDSTQHAVSDKVGTVASASTADAISIPIADISLRNNPALVEQLVQVYRSQLAANPHDETTHAALDRLEERSLADIQTLIAQDDVAGTDKSLEIFSRLFPEMSDNVRYKYLVARTQYMRRQKNDESVPKFEEADVTAAIPNAIATAPPANVSLPSAVVAKAGVTNKTAENMPSSKPEIRAVSITPGRMTEGRFVPSDGGNVFMVELSYSNFAKAFIEKNEATLVTLLGEPGEPLVLAEVPITISADRGTKSFAIETNNVQGYAGGKFRLNFMLNDEFLTSRTLRLSNPSQ